MLIDVEPAQIKLGSVRLERVEKAVDRIRPEYRPFSDIALVH
jgi:hypothetical protein